MNQARAYAADNPIDRDSWGTEPCLFASLDEEFSFGLDAAASAENALVPAFITRAEDSLVTDWGPRVLSGRSAVWVNPPYSVWAGGLARWVQRCFDQAWEHGLVVVALLPAAIGSAWFNLLHSLAAEIRMLSRRLRHRHPVTRRLVGGSSFGSLVAIFRPGRRGPARYTMMEV